MHIILHAQDTTGWSRFAKMYANDYVICGLNARVVLWFMDLLSARNAGYRVPWPYMHAEA